MGNRSPLLSSSTYSAWCHMSDEMYSRADAHRSLLRFGAWEATPVKLCNRKNRVWFSFQIFGKRFSARSHSGTTAAFRRAHQEEEACMTVCLLGLCRHGASPMVSVLSQFDGAIDRTGKLVTLNWSEQLKVRKTPFRSQRGRVTVCIQFQRK